MPTYTIEQLKELVKAELNLLAQNAPDFGCVGIKDAIYNNDRLPPENEGTPLDRRNALLAIYLFAKQYNMPKIAIMTNAGESGRGVFALILANKEKEDGRQLSLGQINTKQIKSLDTLNSDLINAIKEFHASQEQKDTIILSQTFGDAQANSHFVAVQLTKTRNGGVNIDYADSMLAAADSPLGRAAQATLKMCAEKAGFGQVNVTAKALLAAEAQDGQDCLLHAVKNLLVWQHNGKLIHFDARQLRQAVVEALDNWGTDGAILDQVEVREDKSNAPVAPSGGQGESAEQKPNSANDTPFNPNLIAAMLQTWTGCVEIKVCAAGVNKSEQCVISSENQTALRNLTNIIKNLGLKVELSAHNDEIYVKWEVLNALALKLSKACATYIEGRNKCERDYYGSFDRFFGGYSKLEKINAVKRLQAGTIEMKDLSILRSGNVGKIVAASMQKNGNPELVATEYAQKINPPSKAELESDAMNRLQSNPKRG